MIEQKAIEKIHCANCLHTFALPLPCIDDGDRLMETAEVLHFNFCKQNRILCGAPNLTVFCSLAITNKKETEENG